MFVAINLICWNLFFNATSDIFETNFVPSALAYFRQHAATIKSQSARTLKLRLGKSVNTFSRSMRQIPFLAIIYFSLYRESPTSKVSTSTISTSTNFRAIGIELVIVEFLPDCYVVKFVLVEIGYVIPTSTNFA